MSTKLAKINELKPIAARMREREDVISFNEQAWKGKMNELCILAIEQGQDLLLVESIIDGHMRLDDWRAAHVPNMRADRAPKYKRAASENLNPDQMFFLFKEAPEPKQICDVRRTKANPWEDAWGFMHKFKRTLLETPITTWPAAQVDATRTELEPVARALWPERF